MTRPSVFGSLGALTPEPEAQKIKATAPAPEKDKGVIKTSTYLPREVHDVLREIAFHERIKVHDLLMEGVDHILKTRRHPSIEELRKKEGP